MKKTWCLIVLLITVMLCSTISLAQNSIDSEPYVFMDDVINGTERNPRQLPMVEGTREGDETVTSDPLNQTPKPIPIRTDRISSFEKTIDYEFEYWKIFVVLGVFVSFIIFIIVRSRRRAKQGKV